MRAGDWATRPSPGPQAESWAIGRFKAEGNSRIACYSATPGPFPIAL
jgi:hypothetical protein